MFQMDLILTRSLLAVAEHGSIGEAAEALALSQPALSRRIQQLEQYLETELVVRSGRGIALTEMGRLAVREGRLLVERFERLREDIARHERLEAGVVRVGGGATAVSYLLPQAIALFQAQHPTVRFEVREAGSREVERSVVLEEAELGVVTLPVLSGELLARPLFRDKIVLVRGKQHPLAGKKRVSLADINGLSVVGFEAASAIRQLIDAALRRAEISVNVVMELRSIAAILRMVEVTSSLAFVSELGARPEQVLHVTGLRIERKLALISKRERTLSPAAAAFAELLLAGHEGGAKAASGRHKRALSATSRSAPAK